MPMEKPPDSVLQGLNEIGFKVSAPKESPGMPASSFSSTQKLADHAYEVSNIEDEYLRERRIDVEDVERRVLDRQDEGARTHLPASHHSPRHLLPFAKKQKKGATRGK